MGVKVAVIRCSSSNDVSPPATVIALANRLPCSSTGISSGVWSTKPARRMTFCAAGSRVKARNSLAIKGKRRAGTYRNIGAVSG